MFSVLPSTRAVQGYDRLRVVTEDFEFRSKVKLRIKVRSGFTTDLASVPRPLWWLFPPVGAYSPAAILHDALYATHVLPRDVSDALFYEAMEALKVPGWKRWMLYIGVKYFGKLAWSRLANPSEKRFIEVINESNSISDSTSTVT